ncbi:MAG: carbon storage regulator CsrA [Anaerolineae bacterium]
MLVLGRKTNESILIGDDIEITILGVEGDRVKVGIKAPNSVRILRQELYETVKAENLRAATAHQQPNEALLTSLQGLLQAKNGS